MTSREELMSRGYTLCSRSIGLQLSVTKRDHMNRRTGTIKGKIIDAEPDGFNGRDMVFRVTLECGTAKTHREFFVKRLPRRPLR